MGHQLVVFDKIIGFQVFLHLNHRNTITEYYKNILKIYLELFFKDSKYLPT